MDELQYSPDEMEMAGIGGASRCLHTFLSKRLKEEAHEAICAATIYASFPAEAG